MNLIVLHLILMLLTLGNAISDQCSSVGLLPEDNNDSTCIKNFACYAEDSSLAQMKCPHAKFFDTKSGECIPNKKCQNYEQRNAQDDLFAEEIFCTNYGPDNFTCTEEGRFRVPYDHGCSFYYKCSEAKDGTFQKDKYSCKRYHYFDPATSACTKDYECPCWRYETSPLPTEAPWTETVPTEVTRQEITTKNPTNFKCNVPGRYENREDQSCISYYWCNRLQNGSMVNWIFSCPGGETGQSHFDPKLGRCSLDYHCSSDKIPGMIPKPDFICPTIGRFAVPRDYSCSHYYLCNQFLNGTIWHYEFPCPKKSYFNPTLGRCSKEYECPYFALLNRKPKCSENGTSAPFVCSKEGRFRNPTSCDKYHMCTKIKNGKLYQTEHVCSNGMLFDDKKGICTKDFECPCI